MRKQAKFVAVLSAAALLAVGASMTAFAATPHWDMEDGEWVYLDRNGDRVTDVWKKSNGQWYYLDSDGYMAKDQVIEDDDDAYYVGADGARVTNAWVSMDNDDLLDDDDEPESIDTVWMFFDGSGKAVGFGESNDVVKKLNYGDGQSGYFMFNTDGYMQSGWKIRTSSGKDELYYLGDQNEGWARTGWHQLEVNIDLPVFNGIDEDDDGETEWFYFRPNGKAYVNTTQGYNGKTYVFDGYGRMLDLWAYKEDGTNFTNNASASSAYTTKNDAGVKSTPSVAAYYAEDNGGRDKAWVHAYPKSDYTEYDDDPYWFWLDSKGRPFLAGENGNGSGRAVRKDDTDKSTKADEVEYSGVVEAKVIKNNTYLFNNKGVMLTGLYQLYNVPKGSSSHLQGLYLFDKSGYPSSNEGKMVTNKKVKIDVDGEDETYYFGKNGEAYASAVVSSLVYGPDGKLVTEYGDGSTYEMAYLANVGWGANLKADGSFLNWNADSDTLVLLDKNKKVVVKGTATDRVLINGYGRIKLSNSAKDIDGNNVSINKDGVVEKVESK